MVMKGLTEVKPVACGATSASSGHSGEAVAPMKELGTAEVDMGKKDFWRRMR